MGSVVCGIVFFNLIVSCGGGVFINGCDVDNVL